MDMAVRFFRCLLLWIGLASPVALSLAALSLGGCQPAPKPERLTLQAFGTLVDITLYPAGAVYAADATGATRSLDLVALEAALTESLDAMHAAWHAWLPGPLMDTNRQLTAGAWFIPDPDIDLLIRRAQQLEVATEGLFNPAIGGLIAAWGFHQNEPAGPPPTADALAEWLANPPRMAAIEARDGELRGQHPRLQLDFGGLAKGLALIRSAELLQAYGVERAIVNAGGDLLTLGRPSQRPWLIGVRDPRGAGVLAGIELGADEAVFSSGTYERGYTWEGQRVHHVIDPRSGRPSEGLLAVTVVHPDPLLADAAATALLLAGPDRWPEFAVRLGLSEVMVVLPDGKVELTPSLSSRVRFSAGVEWLERALPDS